MDDETFYVGKEIQDAGFANDWEKITEKENTPEPDAELFASARANIIVNAKMSFNQTIEKAREAKSKNTDLYNSDLKKAVALYEISPKPSAEQAAKPNAMKGKDIKAIGGFMKPEELLAQDKSCYDAVFALGEKAALEKERSRVAAHIKRGEKVGAMDIAIKHIQGGASVLDEVVNDEYFTAALDKKRIEARNQDNPPPTNTGSDDGSVDEKQLNAAFENGFKGRDVGGKTWE
jgi:hypothetical protein